MTIKEAIEIVQTFRQVMDTPITEHRDILLGALDMAIQALQEKQDNEDKLNKLIDDLAKEYGEE